MPKAKFRYGYLYGNKGRRKMRSPHFDNEYHRDMYASADSSLGFRVRKYKVRVPPNKPKTTVV